MSSILIIEDEHALAAALSTIVRRCGAEPIVAASAQSGLDKLAKKHPDLIVLDIGLPDMSGIEVLKRIRAASDQTKVLVITAHGTLENALEARRLGASEYFLKPLDLTEFQQAIRAFITAPPAQTATAKSERGRTTLMIGATAPMQRAYAAIAQASATDAPLLITGPSGAGKSLAARVIHSSSSRKCAPFASFRSDDWTSEKLEGAFFGGDVETDVASQAKRGTLFVEEIARLPLPFQARLEKWLNAQTDHNAPRLIASTSDDLLERVRQGRFREDLYYRLNIVEVTLPALRERTEDIEALAAFYLHQFAGARRDLALTQATLACLKAHPWPGNVRELRNAMQHAAAVCTGAAVLPRHLPESIARHTTAADAASHLDTALEQALTQWLDQKLTAPEEELPAYDDIAGQVEALMLKMLLPRFDNKPTRLAAALKMNRATLRRKCRDLMQ